MKPTSAIILSFSSYSFFSPSYPSVLRLRSRFYIDFVENQNYEEIAWTAFATLGHSNNLSLRIKVSDLDFILLVLMEFFWEINSYLYDSTHVELVLFDFKDFGT